MIQRQLYVYFVLVMSMVLNLFQLSAVPMVNASVAVGGKQRSMPASVPAVQKVTSFSPVSLPLPPRPSLTDTKYNIDVVMDYARHFLTVEEIITYPNRTNTRLDSLTLAVAPNLTPNCFDLIKLAVNSIPTTEYKLNGHRLDVKLPSPLATNSVVQLTIRYTLSLPYVDQSSNIDAPVFGYTDMQTNLINWYAFIVPYADGQWTLHDPWWYGDYLVYPTADYMVNLLFVGKETAPLVAASGSPERIVDFTRYTLEDGRAFAFSISPKFQVSSMKAGNTIVSSYYLPAFRKPAEAAMQASAQAIDLFSEQFGEYPRSTYSIVQAGLNDSREFSGLSFISRNFYQTYDGTPANSLTYASVHAVAHQWWSDQVGNDPATEPWLDESLATYSEMLFFEHTHPNKLDTWQANRVDFFRPQGHIDAAIYSNTTHDAYKQAVYLNGMYFLSDLRKQIGGHTFDNFLEDYYRQGKGKILTSKDFFRILNEHTKTDYADLVHKYFAHK